MTNFVLISLSVAGEEDRVLPDQYERHRDLNEQQYSAPKVSNALPMPNLQEIYNFARNCGHNVPR